MGSSESSVHGTVLAGVVSTQDWCGFGATSSYIEHIDPPDPDRKVSIDDNASTTAATFSSYNSELSTFEFSSQQPLLRLVDFAVREATLRSVGTGDDFQRRAPSLIFDGCKEMTLKVSLQNIGISMVNNIHLLNAVSQVVNESDTVTHAEFQAFLASYTAELSPKTESLFWRCNEAIRSKEPSRVALWLDYTFNLILALRTLPENAQTAYRLINESPEALGWRLGDVVVFHAFTSMAMQEHNIWEHVDETSTDCTLLEIVQLPGFAGRRIDQFSLYPSEGEILLEPGATFEVHSEGTCEPPMSRYGTGESSPRVAAPVVCRMTLRQLANDRLLGIPL